MLRANDITVYSVCIYVCLPIRSSIGRAVQYINANTGVVVPHFDRCHCGRTHCFPSIVLFSFPFFPRPNITMRLKEIADRSNSRLISFSLAAVKYDEIP